MTAPAVRKPAKRRRKVKPKTTPKGGRPTGLTEKIHLRLVEHVRKGLFLSTAAQAEGIPPKTVLSWFRRGAGLDPERAPTKPFVTFAADIDRARAAAIEDRVVRIEEAGKGGQVIKVVTITRRDGSQVTTEERMLPDWRADGWALERMERELYGAKSTTHVEGTITVKHVDALAEGFFGVVRRFVPDDQVEGVVLEIGKVIDAALGTPRVRLDGPVKA